MIVDLPEDPAVTADRAEWTVLIGALQSAKAQLQIAALSTRTEASVDVIGGAEQALYLVEEALRKAELR